MTSIEARDALARLIANPHGDLAGKRDPPSFINAVAVRIDDLASAVREEERRDVKSKLEALAALRATKREVVVGNWPVTFYSDSADGAALLAGWIAGVREQRDGL